MKKRIISLADDVTSCRKILNYDLKIEELSEIFDLHCLAKDFKEEGISYPVAAIIDLDSDIILFNSKDHIHRQKFSIAHEIGHFVLEHKGVTIHQPDYDSKSKDEIDANLFAAHLLIPTSLLDKHKNEPSAEEISKLFNVSTECARIRLIENTLYRNTQDYIQKRSNEMYEELELYPSFYD